MQRGENGSAIFVLLNGSVLIETIKADGAAYTLKVVSTGEIFGLAALMCGKPRVATATALAGAEVLVLDWERLQRIARLYPRSAYLLFKNLSAIMGERLANQAAFPEPQLPSSESGAILADVESC
jgi:CRP-like cAMP-binding protein